MTWVIKFSESAQKTLNSLDVPTKKRILSFVEERLSCHPVPDELAEPLQGSSWKSLFRYRVGNYRLICRIEKNIFLISVLKIGHRREIYQH